MMLHYNYFIGSITGFKKKEKFYQHANKSAKYKVYHQSVTKTSKRYTASLDIQL